MSDNRGDRSGASVATILLVLIFMALVTGFVITLDFLGSMASGQIQVQCK